jgi:putative transcriptional regulator
VLLEAVRKSLSLKVPARTLERHFPCWRQRAQPRVDEDVSGRLGCAPAFVQARPPRHWHDGARRQILAAGRIVNRALTRIADDARLGLNMQRLRLKADGRIVELRDGQEFPLAPAMIAVAPATTSVAPGEPVTLPLVRDLRRRARLTQLEFAARLGVPVETIRNWEQGKRMPRGPARALLAVIAHAPETVFAALAPGI